METILVTGATGCTGSGILRYFKDSRDYRLVGLTRRRDQKNENNILFAHGDLTNKKQLTQIFQEYNIDAVWHVAGAVDPHINKKQFMQVNYFGTENLLNAAIDANVKVFNFISSVAVYGIKLHPQVSESFMPKPLGLYSRSKLQAEQLITEVTKEVGITGGILRPPLILGYGDRHFYPRVKKLLKYNLFPIMGKPNHHIAVVHPYDIAQGLDILNKAKKEIEPYNISSINVGFKELIKEIEEHLYNKSRWKIHLPFALLYGATLIFEIISKILVPKKEPVFNREYATMIGKEWTFDISKLKGLGYKPKMSLQLIIKDLVKEKPIPPLEEVKTEILIAQR
ncbi:MAG: NAD-dependent epimerase/dehydratase family protein [Candidatus Heimdallarchaeaceae archaeon]